MHVRVPTCPNREQREADEATEEARSRKWGRSRAWSSHGHGEGGTGEAHHHAGHSGRRRRRDFLGYYKIIGVDPEGELPHHRHELYCVLGRRLQVVDTCRHFD
jgi:hypothetical protein